MLNEGYCYECEFYNDGICKRSGVEPSRLCPSFTLTQTAQAKRYVSAKRYAEKIGMIYDASGVIFAGYPRNVRKLIRFFERREKK